MTDRQMTLFEAIEKDGENSGNQPKQHEDEIFFLATVDRRECVICSADFEPNRPSANVCSAACRRVRRLQYGAAYRKDIREKRAKILAMFGGRQPTEEDFLRIVQERKDRN